jgi:rubrerythrin
MRKLRDERTCADCRKAKRTEPDVRWYRSKETGPEGEPVWTCHQCFSDRANHPDLNAAGAPRKRMPPHKNGGKKAQKPSSAPPRHCPSCDRTKQSSQWRKSGEHTVCTACYQRHLRARKYRQREPVGTFAI